MSYDVLDAPIRSLDLSVRARNTLDTLGAKTLRDVQNLGESELLSARGCGKTTTLEIRKFMEQCGLRLKGFPRVVTAEHVKGELGPAGECDGALLTPMTEPLREELLELERLRAWRDALRTAIREGASGFQALDMANTVMMGGQPPAETERGT